MEIATEIGLVGLGIYLYILIFGFKDEIIRFMKIVFTKSKLGEHYLISIVLSLFLYIFLIDSNINFPFHRPIVLIILIISLAFLYSHKKNFTDE